MTMTSSSSSASKRVTVRDIATAAGVALTTVSAALSGSGRISDTQRERIRQIAKDLGYQPKLAAQLLRARATGHIGLLLPDTDGLPSESGHAGPILAEFVKLCEKRNIPYHIEFVPVSADCHFEPPRALSGGLVDGVLVGGFISKELRSWLQNEHHSWISLDEPADFSIVSSGNEGIYQAAQKLAALGHRRIAYAGGPSCYITHELGYQGFRRAVQEFQLVVDDATMIREFSAGTRRSRLTDAADWAKELLAIPEPPTAVICHGSGLARGIIYHAMLSGIRIPEQLSLIAVASEGDAERSLPCLSAVQVDFSSMVEQAMDMLLRRVSGKQNEPETRWISPRLVMRDTVARPG